MNYTEAMDFIHGTLKFGSKLGLENIKKLLSLMGDPQDRLKFIHIAGTNGKGSTAAFTSSILMEAGYRVGIFTSPYIQRFEERIKINKTEIGKQKLADITAKVKSCIQIMLNEGFNHPTEFEIITAIAFQYFCDNKCDIVVLEVGLGGRYDSTNIIKSPLVCAITTISYDHTDILGDTLGKIAFEKAGILKEGTELVLYPQCEESYKVISEIAQQKKINIIMAEFEEIRNVYFDGTFQCFEYKHHKGLKLSILGVHQTKNASMAMEIVNILSQKGYTIAEEQIRRGLEKAEWPGRFEILNKKPVLVIDGAHNIEGAKVLVSNLKYYFPDKRVNFILGMSKDKDYESVVKLITPMAQQIITVQSKNEKSLDINILKNVSRKYCKNVSKSDTIEAAVRTSFDNCDDNTIVCAFGSLYYIGEIRYLFNKS